MECYFYGSDVLSDAQPFVIGCMPCCLNIYIMENLKVHVFKPTSTTIYINKTVA